MLQKCALRQLLEGRDELMPKPLRRLREDGVLQDETSRILEDPKGLPASICGGIENSKVICS